MKSDLMFKVVVDSPEKLLEREDVRYVHFCKRKHNRPEELEILFANGVLYFSDTANEKEVEQFSELIDKCLRQEHMDGKRQDARFDKVRDRFGDDGETTMVDMWFWKAKNERRQNGKKDD